MHALHFPDLGVIAQDVATALRVIGPANVVDDDEGKEMVRLAQILILASFEIEL